MDKVLQIRADIQIKFKYTCRYCGITELGTTERLSVQTNCLDDIKRTLEYSKPTSSGMPIGWGYVDIDKYLCPDCRETATEEYFKNKK